VRVFATWPDLEPYPGVFAPNWVAKYEQLFAALPAGSKVIIDVVGSPRWETGSSDPHTPPANPNDYASFLGQIAKRWAGRVAAYEIWNEEDASRWWAGGPDAAAYAELLKATYPVVKAADPSVEVVLGGLTGNDYQFLQDVYQAGGKGSFDVVGVHTDTACNILSPYMFLRGSDHRMIDDSFLAYREVHATMLANGDDKPIWMTETSWRTTTVTCPEGAWAGQKPEGVTPEQQATFLTQAYHCMAQDAYLQVALWFPLQDENGTVSGLVRANGAHKPSFDAMRSFEQNGDQLTERCGETGPAITIASPGDHQSYEGSMPIRAFATSSVGVWRVRLEVDGTLIRNFDDMSYPSTLSGATMWEGGAHLSQGMHTLTVSADDKEGNVTHASVIVFHGARSAAGAHGKRKPAHHGKAKRRKTKQRKHKRKHAHHSRRR
jgi:hypothetical protein